MPQDTCKYDRIISNPTSSTSLVASVDLLVDVRCCGEVLGVAANVLGVGILVNTDPVDLHGCGERQVVDVDIAEVPRHAQVSDQILCIPQ